jgi:hypothetical protein
VDDGRRYRFLEDNPAVTRAGWLPPAAEVPELADLRANHERLIAAVEETAQEASALSRKRNAELEAQRAAHERGFIGGEPQKMPPLTVGDDQVAEAVFQADAARDALQTYVQTVIAEIKQREQKLLDQMDEIRRAADVRRAEAQRMLDEAELAELSTKKLSGWLARATERSHLGHYPYDELPLPVPVADQMRTLADLHEAAHPEMGFEEIHEIDGVAFGTDDPANLDPDDRPWEQVLVEEEAQHVR